jgi:hypothetical protein
MSVPPGWRVRSKPGGEVTSAPPSFLAFFLARAVSFFSLFLLFCLSFLRVALSDSEESAAVSPEVTEA